MNAESNTMKRRSFVKQSALTAGTLPLFTAITSKSASANDLIMVGIVGCGGRGKAAMQDAIRAYNGTRIVTAADLFQDRIRSLRAVLYKYDYQLANNLCFEGWTAFQDVLNADIDYVVLATPPVFRPMMLRAAIEAGKHVFMEKPAAVDAPGIRSILETAKLADEKGLSIVAGTQRRHQASYRETISRIHDGAIGDIQQLNVYWCGGPIGFRPRQNNMSEMEYQIRNWYHYLWLSGDHIVEQHVHNLDIGCWAMDAYPVTARGYGGRSWQEMGNIWDHHTVEYDFENGVRMMSMCEQMPGGLSKVEEQAIGTKGRSNCKDWIGGETSWNYDGEYQSPYVQEHAHLVEAIRSGNPLNEAETIAKSTLVGIMGRMAGYEAREVTFEEALNSDISYTPKRYELGDLPDVPVQIPGGEPFDESIGWNPDPS